MSVTVLYGDTPSTCAAARQDGDRLWLSAEDLHETTGWLRKPEGLCRGDACIPVSGEWVDAQGRIEVTALAERLGQPVVGDTGRSVWAFGTSARRRGEDLMSLQAPDFTLPDLDGRPHSLRDFRGSKVFLHTFGSY
jgi:hypothetical protein